MADVDWDVQFAPGFTWKSADGSIVWVSLEKYVRADKGISTRRGRPNETDQDRTGTISLALNNADRRFDPDHGSGPYFGDLVPGVPWRLLAIHDGVTYPVARGTCDGWDQEYVKGDRWALVPIHITDGFDNLASAGLPKSPYHWEVEQDAPVAWWPLTEERGDVAGSAVSPGYDGLYQGDPVESGSARRPLVVGSAPPVHFDGVDDAVFLPDAATDVLRSIDDGVGNYTGAEYTVEVWFRTAQVVPSPRQAVILLRDNTVSPVPLHRGGFLMQQSRTTQGIAAGFSGHLSVGEYGDFAVRMNDPVNDNLPHHVVARVVDVAGQANTTLRYDATSPSVTANPADIFIYNGTDSYIGAPPKTDLLDDFWNGDIQHLAIYDYELGDARVDAHHLAGTNPWNGDSTTTRIGRILDIVGWPASLRNLFPGDQTLPAAGALGGYALAYLKRIEATEQGRIFIDRSGNVRFLNRYFFLTIAESATSQVTLDECDYADVKIGKSRDLLFNRWTGNRDGGDTVEVKDQASIDLHGERSNPAGMTSNLLVDSDVLVRAILEYRLSRCKDPQQRMRHVEINLDGVDDFVAAKLLGLELGYRITLRRTPQGVGTAIESQVIVESIEHDISRSGWKMRLSLSPVDLTNFALWGSALWGTGLWGL